MRLAPITNLAHTAVSQSKNLTQQEENTAEVTKKSLIRVAAVHIVFASRTSQEFITPQSVDELEIWTGQVRVIVCSLFCW